MCSSHKSCDFWQLPCMQLCLLVVLFILARWTKFHSSIEKISFLSTHAEPLFLRCMICSYHMKKNYDDRSNSSSSRGAFQAWWPNINQFVTESTSVDHFTQSIARLLGYQFRSHFKMLLF